MDDRAATSAIDDRSFPSPINRKAQMFTTLILAIVIVALVSSGLGLNTGFVPTPQDTQMQMESAITKTADFVGTSKDLGSGFAPGGIGMPVAAVVQVTAFDHTTGDETYTLVLRESDDDSTYTDAGPIISVTGVSNLSVPGFISKRYSRLTLHAAGTTPSITYSAWLNPNLG
jgi:hypothetical protein